MSVDHIRYDILAQEALRSVLRRVLSDAAKNGLPGDHHFYISLDTNAPGVRMSARLHAQYPEEITIVLQHQFWDLVVGDELFEIGLSFGGVPEHLVVPFAAIRRFFRRPKGVRWPATCRQNPLPMRQPRRRRAPPPRRQRRPRSLPTVPRRPPRLPRRKKRTSPPAAARSCGSIAFARSDHTRNPRSSASPSSFPP